MMELERREREVRLGVGVGVGEEGSEGSAMERGDMGSVEKKQPRHFCKTDFSNSKEEQEGREWNGEQNREKKEEKKGGGGGGEVSSTSSGFWTVTVSFPCPYTRLACTLLN